MSLAAVGVSLFILILALLLVLNLLGWGLSVVFDRKQRNRQEMLAERAAREALRLGMERLRCQPPSSQ